MRISLITERERVSPEERHIWDEISREHGKITASWPILLHRPEIAGRVAHLGAYMRFESDMPQAQTQFLSLVVAREYDCEYLWGGHVPQAIKAGVSPEAIQAISTFAEESAFQGDEGVIVKFTRELIREHRVADQTFEAALKIFGEDGLVEITVRIGYYGLLACSLNAFEVEGEELIYRTSDQHGTVDGQVRWFCTACMLPFLVDAETTPTVCPVGHQKDDPALTAATPKLPRVER